MFRSLSTFIFGSSKTDENCERNNCSGNLKEQHNNIFRDNDPKTCFDKDKTLIAESLPTPVNIGGLQKVKRNKDRRGNKKNKSKIQDQFTNTNLKSNLGIIVSEPYDKDLDSEENDWIFLDKEVDLNLNENNIRTSTPTLEISYELQPKEESLPRNDISKDSHQKKNKNDQRRDHKNSISTSFRECDIEKKKELSLLHSSSLNVRRNSSNEDRCNEAVRPQVSSEYGVPRSLRIDLRRNVSLDSCAKLFTMVDSWYMTPPSCFDSSGPIHLEISPIENLLIEHPSMSIYRTIGPAQKGIESFVNFDYEVDEINHMDRSHVNIAQKGQRKRSSKENKSSQPVYAERSSGPRIDQRETALLKMQLFALNSQKSWAMGERHNLRRNAILRSNQVREIQSRCHRLRRTDVQHCRLNSGVNNNRKCC